MQSEAVLSPDGRYRYWLGRRWSAGDRLATFVMLNPSVADASRDDPTLRRCIAFARREGCDALQVVNLFAWRATDPRELRSVADPVGPDNDWHLQQAFARSSRVIAAWGNHATVERVREVVGLTSRQFDCLGVTAAGNPRHPLYVPSQQPLVAWSLG